jgi:hypothetical protein
MGLSLRVLQRLVASGLLVWFCLLFHFLHQEGPWSSAPDIRKVAHRNEFHRMSLQDIRRAKGAVEQWQRQTERFHDGREFRSNQVVVPSNLDTTVHGVDPQSTSDTTATPKPRKMSRRYQTRDTPNMAQEFFQPSATFERQWLSNTSMSNLRLPLPIIVMGFPKAGTSSIFSFFHRQGLKAQHWYCCNPQPSPQKGGPELMAGCMMKNIRHNQTNIFQGCGDDTLEVFSEINGPRRKKIHPLTGKTGYLNDDGSIDYNGPGNRIFLPQHFRIHQIHEAYPNATWVLNHRPIDSWMKSVLSWGDDLHNQFFNEYYMQGAISEIPSDNNMTSVRALLQRIYQEHYDMVIDFVRKHPSHALVQVNITDENAGKVLGQEFGLDPLAWSNVNKNRKGEFEAWRRHRTYHQTYDFENSSLWWLLISVTLIYMGYFLGIEVV